MAPSTHPQRIPCLKTLRWDSQALCERVRDESCFLTCGERRCWNLSSQLLLYCDILHSNFPYFTESDASLISTELRSQFWHLLPQYVVEICTLCCVILFTVSNCNGNGITCESRVEVTCEVTCSPNWSKHWTKRARIETAACMCVFEWIWETTVCFCVTQNGKSEKRKLLIWEETGK